MIANWLVPGAIAIVMGAVLAAALGRYSTPAGFLRCWVMYSAGVVGLGLAGAYGGIVMRSAFCSTVWYAECL